MVIVQCHRWQNNLPCQVAMEELGCRQKKDNKVISKVLIAENKLPSSRVMIEAGC